MIKEVNSKKFLEQWKQAEVLNKYLYIGLAEKAKELGISILSIHDSFVLEGPPDEVNKLLDWMRTKVQIYIKAGQIPIEEE